MRNTLFILITLITVPSSSAQDSSQAKIDKAIEHMLQTKRALFTRCAVLSEVQEFSYAWSGRDDEPPFPLFTPAREIFVSHYTDDKRIGYYARHQYDPQGISDGIWFEDLIDWKTREHRHRMTLNRNPPAYDKIELTTSRFRVPFDSWIGVRYGPGFTDVRKLLRQHDAPPIDIGDGRIKTSWKEGKNTGYMIHHTKVDYMPIEVQWQYEWQGREVKRLVTTNTRIKWTKVDGMWLADSLDRLRAEGAPVVLRGPLPQADQELGYAEELMKQKNRRSVYKFKYLIDDQCPNNIFQWNIVDMRRPVWASFGLVVAPNGPGNPFGNVPQASPFPTNPN